MANYIGMVMPLRFCKRTRVAACLVGQDKTGDIPVYSAIPRAIADFGIIYGYDERIQFAYTRR